MAHLILKKRYWIKYVQVIRSIDKSKLIGSSFIETTYIENKPYILLSGENHSECYDY